MKFAGPFELQQIGRLKTVQNDLVIGLATDLRKVDVLQPVWKETIEKYVAKHETLLLAAVSAGYGEGGDKHGQIWSYPGCILFAISLLTTLGKVFSKYLTISTSSISSQCFLSI